MKNLLILLASFIFLFSFSACEDEESFEFVAKQPTTELEFANSFLSEYRITPEIEGNIAERFLWEPLDFDAPVNVTYQILISTDLGFETYDTLAQTSETQVSVTVGELITRAMELEEEGNVGSEDPFTGTVYLKLRGFTGAGGSNAMMVESEIQPMNLWWPETLLAQPLKNLYFVGNATPDNWNNNSNNTPLFRDPTNQFVFYYTGYFNAGEFKLLEVKGQWQPQWGQNSGTLAVNDGTGSDPSSFMIASAGYYSFEVNIDEMTYTLEPYDASAATEYPTIGFLGDATPGGWDNDTDLTQSSIDDHIWYANGVSLTDGEMKFRANNAWDTNWGGNTPISGQGSFNGPNIPVTAGTYDIWFNDITGRYILILQE